MQQNKYYRINLNAELKDTFFAEDSNQKNKICHVLAVKHENYGSNGP